MVVLKYFYQGFVGSMQEREFADNEKAEQYVKDHANEINTLTYTISPK